MRQLFFSALAREDLQQIARYIARDNPGRARTFVGELRVCCARLLDQPNQGIPRDDYARGLRMISHGAMFRLSVSCMPQGTLDVYSNQAALITRPKPLKMAYPQKSPRP
ncbi:type II toxin-antitoxin system RelE/ParE family toxin [Pseudomonas sp. ES3]|jgi:plasmid stabilization system protein ParE|uniref:type II toxin-antitoxin system RelE/ParE family toxin n=1 Tax=Pseudomonas sp. ES3 TaxID=3424776 RepID=UPI003D358EA1